MRVAGERDGEEMALVVVAKRSGHALQERRVVVKENLKIWKLERGRTFEDVLELVGCTLHE